MNSQHSQSTDSNKKSQVQYGNLYQAASKSELNQVLEVLNSKMEKTLIICPMDDKVCIQIGQYITYQEKSLIAFKNSQQFSTYPTMDSLITYYAQNEHSIDIIEQKKFFQEAKSMKPQTAQQLAQEQYFELNNIDLMDLENDKYNKNSFLVGDECLLIQPQHRYHVHRLFNYDGHLNMYLKSANDLQPSSVLAAMLLQKYLEVSLERLNIQNEQYQVNNQKNYQFTMQEMFGEKPNNDEKTENQQLRIQDLSVIVVVPVDIEASELQLYQDVILHQMGFFAIHFLPRNHTSLIAIGNAATSTSQNIQNSSAQNNTPVPQRGVYFEINIQITSSSLILLCPSCPQLHRRTQNIPQCGLAVLQTFMNLLIGSQDGLISPLKPQNSDPSFGLERLRNMFFAAKSIAQLLYLQNNDNQNHQDQLLTILKLIIPDIQKLENPELLRSTAENVLFQIENGLIEMLIGRSRIFSLKYEDNRQGNIRLVFPDTQTGFRLSFALGPLGLASAFALINDSMVSVPFSSWKPIINQTLIKDVSDEHKAVKVTGKQADVVIQPFQLQLYGKPLMNQINTLHLQRQKDSYLEAIRNQSVRVPISQILQMFFEVVYGAIESKDPLLRQISRPGELADENSRKKLLSELNTSIKQSLIASGQLFLTIPGLLETIQSQSHFQATHSDKGINSYVNFHGGQNDFGKKATALAALSAAADSSPELFLIKNEAEHIGNRLWHERNIFQLQGQ